MLIRGLQTPDLFSEKAAFKIVKKGGASGSHTGFVPRQPVALCAGRLKGSIVRTQRRIIDHFAAVIAACLRTGRLFSFTKIVTDPKDHEVLFFSISGDIITSLGEVLSERKREQLRNEQKNRTET